MGACLSSSADTKASKDIERLMSQAYIMESEKVKLLLLGAGESGKSTIFKQMRVLFGAPLTEEEKQQITPVVYSNTILSMKLLVNAVQNMGYENDVSLHSYGESVINILVKSY
jgi:hypothetical protein